MKSLVLELQQEAYDSSKSVTLLLRKAYVVARKLKIKEFEEWLRLELNGYECEIDSIPEYRKISGDIRAWNAYHGWVPVIIKEPKIADILKNNKASQSISELETFVKSQEKTLLMKYPTQTEIELSKGCKFDTNFSMEFSITQVEKIIEVVRNIVLEWSLKLEEDGIIGHGMSFSEKERSLAYDQRYHVNNFFYEINNSQIQQSTVNSTQTMNRESIDKEELEKVLSLLLGNLEGLKIAKEKELELISEINTINSQLESPNPKSKIVKESLTTIRNILEGITGSLIASGLIYQISQLVN